MWISFGVGANAGVRHYDALFLHHCVIIARHSCPSTPRVIVLWPSNVVMPNTLRTLWCLAPKVARAMLDTEPSPNDVC